MDVIDLSTNNITLHHALEAVKAFEYRDAIPLIREMIPVASPDKAKLLKEALDSWA